MIDSETLSLGPRASIIQLGAVVFGLESFTPVEWKMWNIRSQVDRRVDPDTILWWLGQSDAARTSLTLPFPVGLDVVLDEYAALYENADIEETWCRAQDFDIAILRDCYIQVGKKDPIGKSARDVRTAMKLARITKEEVPRTPEMIEHSTIGDCLHQIACLKKAKNIIDGLFMASNLRIGEACQIKAPNT